MLHGGSCIASLQVFMPRSLPASRLYDISWDTSEQIGSATWLGLGMKWHHFQLASVLFEFDLQQVISAVVYMCKYVISKYVCCRLWLMYIASLCLIDLCHWPLLLMFINTDLFGVEVSSTVCFGHITSWTILHYICMGGWKWSDITFNWLVCCSGLTFNKRSWQLCMWKYLFYPLWLVCEYSKYFISFYQPMINMWNGIDIL
jgi:hypothetical protein